jgi:hypothetical protein
LEWSDLERIARHAGGYYKPFDRRRVRGVGEWRHIDNPVGILKDIQGRILRRILAAYLPPSSMCGGVTGRSTKNHAEPHVGQAVVITLDLKKCFPRISHRQIHNVYVEVIGCSAPIADVLTQLTTFQGRVPQGAPTSPALVNLALLEMHNEIAAITGAARVEMSFYVDDIALSGDSARATVEQVIRVVMSYGHGISCKKKHIMGGAAPQLVTSHIVNAKLGASPARRAAVYARIHELASCEDVKHCDLQSVRGEIGHIAWLNPAHGDVLRRLAERLLPTVGSEGRRPRSGETRACRHRRRHRRKVAR